MPSQSKSASRPSVCFFGDSHLACLKLALDEGVKDAKKYDIEFWGAAGPAFRKLRWRDGAIHPDAEAMEAVQLINQTGRATLDPGDFDVIVFHACRLRAFNYLSEFLETNMGEDAFVSAAVRRASLESWLESIRAFRMARAFAKAGKARIYFTTVPFPTDGIGPDLLADKPNAARAKTKDRKPLWLELRAVFEDLGITLIRQPEETIVRGCMTHPNCALPSADELADSAHKNAHYGALVLDRVFSEIHKDLNRKDAGLQSVA